MAPASLISVPMIGILSKVAHGLSVLPAESDRPFFVSV